MNRRSLLGSLAAGASLTGRRLPGESAWLSEDSVSNVKDFGAVGDAVKDDGPAIQRAVDASHAGKPVLLPAGRYRIRKPIVVHDETVMLGYGRHSIIWCTDPQIDGLVCDGVTRVFLEGVNFDGNATNRDGIVIHNAGDVRIRRCWIKSMGRRGISLENAPCVIMDCTIEMCGEDGLLVTSTNSGEPPHVTSCYMYKNGGHGIHFTKNANQGMVLGSEIVLNGGSGIRIDTVSRMISIVGNSILGNGASGVDLSGGSDYNSLVSNVFSDNGLSGVSITLNSNATVLTANRFLDNCKLRTDGLGELMVKGSVETVLMGNIFGHSPSLKGVPRAILADPGALASSLGNVFHGLAEGG